MNEHHSKFLKTTYLRRFGDLEPPTKSEEDTAHWNHLEEDLIGRNEERDIEGEDSA